MIHTYYGKFKFGTRRVDSTTILTVVRKLFFAFPSCLSLNVLSIYEDDNEDGMNGAGLKSRNLLQVLLHQRSIKVSTWT